MRDAGATTRPRAAGAARASDAAALDDVSDQLGEVLHHADELLAEWARFSAQVRTTIEHEVAGIGGAVATAVDGSVDRAVERTATSVDAAVGRAIETRVGAQLGALSAELARLEQRTRAAARQIGDDRGRDRRLMWGLLAGVCVANVLLAIVLLRGPGPAPAAVTPPAPVETGDPSTAPTEPGANAPVLDPEGSPGLGSGATPGSGADPTTGDPPGSTVPGATLGSGAGSAAAGAGSSADASGSGAAAGSNAAAGSGAVPAPPHGHRVRAGTVPRPKQPRSK